MYLLSSLRAQKAKTLICTKSGVSADSRKCAEKCAKRCGFGHFFVQKVRFCALLAHSLESAETSLFGVQETVLLVNHALARGTPAIFVIFFVSRGSSGKALALLVRMQIRHFRQKTPFFFGGTKARFTKSTVFRTPNFLCRLMFLPFGL